MRTFSNNKGSIMIWTVLLGMMLTTVFFFTATRLQFNSIVQRETIEIVNQKAYLKSFIDHAKSEGNGTYQYDNMMITISDKVDQIEGFLDVGESKLYNFPTTDTLRICWNKTGETGRFVLDGTILDTGTQNCSNSDYNEGRNPALTGSSLLIQALDEPMHYLIESTTGKQITDDKQHVTASVSYGYDQTIEINESF